MACSRERQPSKHHIETEIKEQNGSVTPKFVRFSVQIVDFYQFYSNATLICSAHVYVAQVLRLC